MFQFKTEGLVLRQIPYSDKNKIIKVYSRTHGLFAILISVSSSKLSRARLTLFQPMHLVKLECSQKPGSSFVICKEVTIIHALADCFLNPSKRMQMMFLHEILYRTLTEEHSDPPLFDFVNNALQWLNEKTEKFNNFHLVFLCRLSRLLGFFPTNNYSQNDAPFFHLLDGCFKSQTISIDQMMDREESEAFSRLLDCDFEESGFLILPNYLRRKIVLKLVDYYSVHLVHMREIKSLQVLTEMLNDIG